MSARVVKGTHLSDGHFKRPYLVLGDCQTLLCVDISPPQSLHLSGQGKRLLFTFCEVHLTPYQSFSQPRTLLFEQFYSLLQ